VAADGQRADDGQQGEGGEQSETRKSGTGITAAAGDDEQ
jgi:hypothetical protein